MADVTGDGRADIAGLGENGLMVSTATGTGFNLPEFRIRNLGYNAGSWRSANNPIAVADVSNDGRADVVGFGNDGVWVSFQ